MDHRGPVRAASGADPVPPAGLPQPGSEVGGADEEGGGTNRCHRYPAEGQTHFFCDKRIFGIKIRTILIAVTEKPFNLFHFLSGHACVLLPNGGYTSVFGTYSAHPLLHVGTQGAG